MSFDSSRFPFDPWKDFAGVVMQQGRVQLDSDWNEWLAILMRRIQAGTVDTVGRAVYPVTTPYGFKISTTQDASGRHVQIGAGRMYVDGLLAENHGPAPPTAQTPWDPALAELSGAPQPPPPPSGEILLDFTQQPYFPGAALPQGNGPFLIYLDVWQREVTYLERPDLIEKAVGIDTTGRWQTVWQVRMLDVSKVQGGVTCSTADSSIPPWTAVIQPSAARLTTGIAQSGTPGPCCLTPTTGYTGRENQMYRVEIHKGRNINDASTGSPPAATFKWSRDNASVATTVTAISSGTNSNGGAASVLTVDSTGKDHVLSFMPGDWIEITDDVREFNGQAGDLLQIDVKGVDQTSKTILLTGQVSADIRTNLTSPPANYPLCHTRIRRWDQKGKVFESDGTTVWADLDAATSTGDIPVPPAGTSLILENGVTISFDRIPSSGAFTVGDYWAFAARTSDGSVEQLVQAPPMGVHHHYARLATVTFPNPPSDCRIPWPPSVGTGHDTCACAVCVELADFQADPGAIAKAIDKVKAMGGGRVCLGPGVFALGAPLVLAGLANVTLSGQGPATVLFYAGPGAAVTLQNCFAQRIEDLSIFAYAAAGTWAPTQAFAIGLLVQNCAGLTVSRCGIAAVGASVKSTASTSVTVETNVAASSTLATDVPSGFNVAIATRIDGTKAFTAAAGAVISGVRSIAVALDGFLIESAFRNNVLIADIGIGKLALLRTAQESAARGLLVLAGCQIQDNLLLGMAAGVAIGDAKLRLGTCLHLLETAVDGNTVLGGRLAGIVLEGVTDVGASIRISRNELEVDNIGIATGLDAAVISDNVITQADVAAALRGGPATAGIGICVFGVPGFDLPLFELRVLRNRVAAIAGAGIVLDAPAVATSVLDNAIQGTVGSGIAMGPHALVGDLIVRGNEVLIVSGPKAPGTTGVFGIAAGAAVNAIVADNTVGAIGSIGPIENAAGIALDAIATGTLAGNSVRDIGAADGKGPFPATAGLVALDVLDDLSISGNVVHQASQPAPNGMFTGIAVRTDEKATKVTVSVQDNGVEGTSTEPLIGIVGNADCVIEGNRCRRGGASTRTPVVDVHAATVVAGDNRIDGPKDEAALSISVSRTDKQKRPAATVLGNVVTKQIRLNGQALPDPWAPLNVIL